jgi:hypothetical protein
MSNRAVLAAHCVHDGKGIGGEVKLPSAGEVHVHAKVASQFPLDRIEVLYNGKAVATAVPVKKELTTELDTDQAVGLDRSAGGGTGSGQRPGRMGCMRTRARST